jgi:aminoglycoside 6'-N-acetyltransferase I
MLIKKYKKENHAEIVEILREAFPWFCGTKDETDKEIKNLLNNEGILLMAIEDERAVGMIGAVPHYNGTGWELHPIAVLKTYRGRGFGSALVAALEREIVKRGGIMIYLGSDDEFGTTSLYGVDLYDDTFGKIANIKNTNGHPFPFYEKQGFKIVGVLPDANGIGKPDIFMAKRII